MNIKNITTMIFLTLSFSVFSQSTGETLTDRLDYGLYSCIDRDYYVEVSRKRFVPTTTPSYSIEIFDRSGDSYWYSLSELRTGGRGDCPHILEMNTRNLRIQNLGENPPCFSNPRRSNKRGVQLFEITDSFLQVSLYDENKKLALSCIIEK